MKARSFVFIHLQTPWTVFGLPPRLAAAALAGAFVVYMVVGMALRLPALMVPAAVAAGVFGLARVYRLGRRDRHVETVFLATARFWRSSRCRRLLAGAPPAGSRGGRR